jgi:hypothetical protein
MSCYCEMQAPINLQGLDASIEDVGEQEHRTIHGHAQDEGASLLEALCQWSHFSSGGQEGPKVTENGRFFRVLSSW